MPLCFLGRDRVLSRFRQIELCRSLGLDLNGLSGLGIASHTCFAVNLFQTPQPGHYEQTVLLGLFHSGVGEVFKIGRASCRERVEMWVGEVWLEEKDEVWVCSD